MLAAGFVFVAQGGEQGSKADGVIEQYLAATGGREALASIQDRTTHAKLSVMGMTGTMVWQEKAPNKMHQAVDMIMAKVENWFDGQHGYRLDPMQGAGPYSDQDLEEARENYVIAPLLHYKKRGWTAEYVGEEPVAEKAAQVVRLTEPSGAKHTYYFDSSTHYLVKQVSPLPAREGQGNQELLYSDYRDVSGFKFPFNIKRVTPGMTSEIVVESIEVNSKLDDSIFQYEGDPWRIISRHVQAIGGLAAWQELKSLRRNAILRIVNLQGTASTVWKSPDAFYHEVQLGQTQMKLGSDGKTGWMGDQTASDVAVKDWKTYTFLWSNRYLFPDSGINAYYKGTEKVGERDAYVVSVQFPFGADVTFYYDKESYFLLKDVSRHSAPSINNLLIATFYDDYRTVGRLKLPFRFREEVPLTPPIVAEFEITDYQLNYKAEDSLFQPVVTPQPPK
jgi:hypothetical protein